MHVEEDGCQMTKIRSARSAGWSGRLESTACGNVAVSRGLAMWSVACTGEKFMVGIVPDDRWDAFAKEDPTFVPFVFRGEGFGVGLLEWDGVFLCQNSDFSEGIARTSALWSDKPLDAVPELVPGQAITVVLDMDRRCVEFLLDGIPLPGAQAHVPFDSCRFAASIYGTGMSLRMLLPPASGVCL